MTSRGRFVFYELSFDGPRQVAHATREVRDHLLGLLPVPDGLGFYTIDRRDDGEVLARLYV